MIQHLRNKLLGNEQFRSSFASIIFFVMVFPALFYFFQHKDNDQTLATIKDTPVKQWYLTATIFEKKLFIDRIKSVFNGKISSEDIMRIFFNNASIELLSFHEVLTLVAKISFTKRNILSPSPYLFKKKIEKIISSGESITEKELGTLFSLLVFSNEYQHYSPEITAEKIETLVHMRLCSTLFDTMTSMTLIPLFFNENDDITPISAECSVFSHSITSEEIAEERALLSPAVAEEIFRRGLANGKFRTPISYELSIMILPSVDEKTRDSIEKKVKNSSKIHSSLRPAEKQKKLRQLIIDTLSSTSTQSTTSKSEKKSSKKNIITNTPSSEGVFSEGVSEGIFSEGSFSEGSFSYDSSTKTISQSRISQSPISQSAIDRSMERLSSRDIAFLEEKISHISGPLTFPLFISREKTLFIIFCQKKTGGVPLELEEVRDIIEQSVAQENIIKKQSEQWPLLAAIHKNDHAFIQSHFPSSIKHRVVRFNDSISDSTGKSTPGKSTPDHSITGKSTSDKSEDYFKNILAEKIKNGAQEGDSFFFVLPTDSQDGKNSENAGSYSLAIITKLSSTVKSHGEVSPREVSRSASQNPEYITFCKDHATMVIESSILSFLEKNGANAITSSKSQNNDPVAYDFE